MSTHYVYILASFRRTLCIGVTNDLERRLWEDSSGRGSLFVRRYNVYRLVYVETTDDAAAAIAREKQLKGWRRSKKIALIESVNPAWRDLGAERVAVLRDSTRHPGRDP
ncbi:MAG: GIY-YIG nuclease family protein [Chloroflexaceae bacterium]|nr:GIY-YIG nuclease family protein [Chloroflexaceae bacterium]